MNQAVPESLGRKQFEEVLARFPNRGEARIQTGISYIFSCFRTPPDTTLAALKAFLAAAEETNTPVLVQIDAEHWWEARPDLWNWWDPSKAGFDPANRENVEWTGWSPDTALKLAWRNWGRQIRVLPPPNLASPRYTAACREEIRRLVPVVMDWHARLPQPKKHLLVGIKLGHETSIGVNAYHFPSGDDLLDRPASDDPHGQLDRSDVLSRGMAQIGYAALKSSGIRSDGAPTESELCDVAQRYLEMLCREAARAGVPRERLFAHGAGWKQGELIYDVPVNPYACPGWSFYDHAADPRKDSGVQRNLAKSDAPYWAAAEWLLQGTRQTGAWRDALTNTLADPRCRYVCIFNWENIQSSETVQQAITELVRNAAARNEPAAATGAADTDAPAATGATFCNPLNLNYGWSDKGYRHGADPVVVLFQGRYYLFSTWDLPGYRVSDDLVSWSEILFDDTLRPLMGATPEGTYCAPAVATDGKHVYFIRMGKRGSQVPVMRSADPASGRWEQCGQLRMTADPALFFDDDGRAWLYHGLGTPTKVFEIDRSTWTEIPGSERQIRPAVTDLREFFGGYERGRRELFDDVDAGAWLDTFQILPCQEAAWMTKYRGRYYLQYATPGTVTHWYCDTVMEGDSATGPFHHVDYAPASLKVGGFIGSAGHSSVFQDKYGNWWRATTMWIGVHDLFERRIGLFPVGFDDAGRMFTETTLGDYPQGLPRQPRDPRASNLAGWWVQSYQSACTASSSLADHPPELAADENVRTWWSAETGGTGEWFQMDLGPSHWVHAVQVNHAEQDCTAKAGSVEDGRPRYRLLGSEHGDEWLTLADHSQQPAAGPHTYLALDPPRRLRFLKVVNVSVPAGGKFALRDLRVFGKGDGTPPAAATGLRVQRHSDDDRNATLRWTPAAGADGYLLRFGAGPDQLYHTIQLQGQDHARLTTHVLNRGVPYAWRIDAFNASGLTPGVVAGASAYPIRPVPITAVSVGQGFWHPRFEANRRCTVWYDFQKCEETGRIDNFAKAAKRMSGPHEGIAFNDSDVFKVVEGAAHILALGPDPELQAYTEKVIDLIAAAQEPDGYLYTVRTIHPVDPPGRAGKVRWLNERGGEIGRNDSHELYNAGHMYEAAVAWCQATGQRKLLDVAIKHADLVAQVWGPGPDQLKIPPGHQEIEIGLVKLYQITGDRKYLELAKFLLDCRGRNFDDPKAARKPNPNYSDHLPVTEQAEAVGHAVRSGYMYAAMTDVAALTGDPAYRAAVHRLWDNVVGKKLYLTGSIGGSPAGESFGGNYDLPNATAYNETCAAIANALWNYRMFLLDGDGKYIDVLERVLYNGFLSGVGMSGDRFFYPNPLETDGKAGFNKGENQRSPWFDCSCCPVNDVRFIPSIAGFIYATGDSELFVNLYIAGSAACDLGGRKVRVRQETRYPWNGKASIVLAEVDSAASLTVKLRIPGWLRNQPVPSDLYRYDDGLTPAFKLRVNGNEADFEMDRGYARITRVWKSGDRIDLDFEMPVRRVASHSEVRANANRFAVERGPLVYCAEGADNGGHVLDKIVSGAVRFRVEERPELLGGITTVKMTADADGTSLTCIPYYAWCHRGANEMRVWFPTRPEPEYLASHCSPWPDSPAACFDGKVPEDSSDRRIPRFTWLDRTGTAEWVALRFPRPTKVNAVSVYWFVDPGKKCRVPQNWRLLYEDGGQWKPVDGASEFGARPDQYNRVTFQPVETTALKIEAQLRPGLSAGILEWDIEAADGTSQ